MTIDANRRKLFTISTQLLGVYGLSKLSSCGTAQDELSSFYDAEQNVTVKDMYTHNRGNRGFKGDMLKASDIAKGKPVTLYLTEGNPERGGHRHAFVVEKQHFKKLIAGETVTMKTERAAGHEHTVVIDPSYNPANANSVTINPSQLDGEGTPQGKPQLNLAVSGGDQPSIYLASEAESPEYCIGQIDECANKPENWFKMILEQRLNRKPLYRVSKAVPTGDELTIHIRARKAGELIKRVIKLVKAQPGI